MRIGLREICVCAIAQRLRYSNNNFYCDVEYRLSENFITSWMPGWRTRMTATRIVIQTYCNRVFGFWRRYTCLSENGKNNNTRLVVILDVFRFFFFPHRLRVLWKTIRVNSDVETVRARENEKTKTKFRFSDIGRVVTRAALIRPWCSCSTPVYERNHQRRAFRSSDEIEFKKKLPPSNFDSNAGEDDKPCVVKISQRDWSSAISRCLWM